MALAATVVPVKAGAQDAQSLLYAGFAFAGNHEDRITLYPQSAELSTAEDNSYLDRLLREKLERRPALAARFSQELATGGIDQTAVAFALVQEEIETQRIDGKIWTSVQLQANVLAFNKASRTIVASYPVRMRLTRVGDAEPSQDERRELVRAAFTAVNPAENMLDQWLDRLEKVRIRAGAHKYLRVTELSLAPEAEAVVAASGRSPKAVRNQFANFLEAAVAERAGISILPNSIGEAIGSKMLYRYANGRELQLVIPEPDYELTFRVRDFVSKTLEKPEYAQDIFRVKGTVGLRVAGSRVLLDEDVYDTLVVTRPRRAGVELLLWPQYYKTLQGLLFSIGRQMAAADDAWLKDKASRGMAARDGFVNASQLMKELR